MRKLAEWLNICKEHWKEIFALSFGFHLLTDWIVFLAGYMLGKIT
jgi:hypothetical protein